jgi:uncharacterized protein YndB with AHSA1/START domain
MSHLFETHRHIDAPPAQVWDVLSDVAHWPDWTPTISSVAVLEGDEMRVGLRAAVRQPRLPRAEWTVTEVVPGSSFTWEATGPGLRTVARHVVEPDGTGARVTLSIEQTGPMGAVAAFVWRGLTQRYIETEAESLDRTVTGAPAA